MGGEWTAVVAQADGRAETFQSIQMVVSGFAVAVEDERMGGVAVAYVREVARAKRVVRI